MLNFFRDRLQRDLDRCAAPDGRVDIARVLATWSADPEWVRAALPLPPEERQQILAQLGGETFDRDGGRYATELHDNTRSLDFIWSRNERDELLRKHTEMLFAGAADRVAFGQRAESRRALDEVDVSGFQHVASARAAGRGVMMLSVHQSHPAFGLKHPSLSDLRFSSIVHENVDDGASLSVLLQGISDRVELLAASRGSVRRILKTLQQNQCVTLYIDFVFPESLGVRTALFGQTVWISSSAVAIALRTRATVVPVTIARQYPPSSGRVSVEFYEPIPLDDLDRHCAGDLQRAALRLGIVTECLIRRYPAQWMLWNTLEHRWREAAKAMTGPRALQGAN